MTINSIEKKTNSRSPMKSETVSESEGVEMKLEANRLKDKNRAEFPGQKQRSQVKGIISKYENKVTFHHSQGDTSSDIKGGSHARSMAKIIDVDKKTTLKQLLLPYLEKKQKRNKMPKKPKQTLGSFLIQKGKQINVEPGVNSSLFKRSLQRNPIGSVKNLQNKKLDILLRQSFNKQQKDSVKNFHKSINKKNPFMFTGLRNVKQAQAQKVDYKLDSANSSEVSLNNTKRKRNAHSMPKIHSKHTLGSPSVSHFKAEQISRG
eukprot:CAMPEP_0197001566 /NCGR_PEP_ID=MMETSP1380-20130617/6234_1 /TAXON_ID=5936 /ORGANISM="Euplotes crassus, Strain CT5" /LENGTH=261 /DNA_ID=CAMNT_0042419275 /DNA_START=205 /DNA_END=987 /DNA_ORIENTATION=+